jgi:glycosyltransferase involved in cell wall biosynthesis
VATIGFDGSRLSVAEPTGTETYSWEILRHLAAITDDEIVLYLNAPVLPTVVDRREFSHQPPPNSGELPTRVRLRPIPFPRFWTHVQLSWEMSRHPPDVLFVPAHVVPLRHPSTVVTVHDLGYLVEPASHPPADRRRLDLATRWSVHAARRVIAISESTRRTLIGAYGVPPAKIRVVHHGVADRFGRVDSPDVARVAARYGLPERYLLTVGTIQPRKNLARLVAAMARVRAAGLPHRLVIVGRRGWMADHVDAEIAATGQVGLTMRLGYVPGPDLPAVYAGADGFVLPSLYEGFGLPLLEALASGVPTATSDRGALPEIAGDAALIVGANDVGAIGETLVRLLVDEPLRLRLREAGKERAARFTWEWAAEQTLAVLHEAIGSEHQRPPRLRDTR